MSAEVVDKKGTAGPSRGNVFSTADDLEACMRKHLTKQQQEGGASHPRDLQPQILPVLSKSVIFKRCESRESARQMVKGPDGNTPPCRRARLDPPEVHPR